MEIKTSMSKQIKQIGLRIKTVAGKTFTKMGKVEYKSEYNCFYCGGESFPAEIVCAIITEDNQ